jgi:hypothetical protein
MEFRKLLYFEPVAITHLACHAARTAASADNVRGKQLHVEFRTGNHPLGLASDLKMILSFCTT